MATLGKCRDYGAIPIERRVYLDTETTSLSSGAGVLVFLIGLGVFREQRFEIRQLFLRQPSEERAMLHVLASWLSEAEAVVSFCGKSFDAPRTRDRLLYQNVQDVASKLAAMVHLDLYHAGKRLVGHHMPNHKLQTFESQFLNFARLDDLPGSECAEAYFSYLRGGTHNIDSVFKHNFLDVLGLPVLEGFLLSRARHPVDGIESLMLGMLEHQHGSGCASKHLLQAINAWPESLARAPVPWLLRGARLLKAEGYKREALKLIEPSLATSIKDPRMLALHHHLSRSVQAL
jgi:hypothetical protein